MLINHLSHGAAPRRTPKTTRPQIEESCPSWLKSAANFTRGATPMLGAVEHFLTAREFHGRVRGEAASLGMTFNAAGTLGLLVSVAQHGLGSDPGLALQFAGFALATSGLTHACLSSS